MKNFENDYASLPESFYQRTEATKVANPSLIKFNNEMAQELGLDGIEEKEIIEIFSGNKIPDSSKPLAQAYAGHQFGNFVPQLGDGRALLLGEIIDKDSQRKDVQLKGSGRTAFSRGGDGRAWLGPVIREYLVSEAMHHLGVPTTRSLAAISTGETIRREKELPGAILTRVASSHIRVGTFEYFACRKDHEALKILADYCIQRHYPDCAANYLYFFKAVAAKQSKLVAHWMSLGFIHGVMNTDNSTISGETIDYGPCAFMDFFDSNRVFSSIDHNGRYAYGNQASIVLWNLSCLANCLMILIDPDESKAVPILNEALEKIKLDIDYQVKLAMIKKLGFDEPGEENLKLLFEFLQLLEKNRADFTLAFRYLNKLTSKDSDSKEFFLLFDKPDAELDSWIEQWQAVVKPDDLQEKLDQVNPIFIPRNHLVEEAIEKAHLAHDFSMMHELAEVWKNPYQFQEQFTNFTKAPVDKETDYMTFCGT